MSGKIEKKQPKPAREKSKATKERDSAYELPIDGMKFDDVPRSTSPRSIKKSRKNSTTPEVATNPQGLQGSPVMVRFDPTSPDISREKISGRSSSAGPPASFDIRKDSSGRNLSSDPSASSDDAEALVQILKDFVAQISPPLTLVVRKNQELKAQVSSLLKAAKQDELPFQTIVRERENIKSDYDLLRMEYGLLQRDFDTLKLDYMELNSSHQYLANENAQLKEKIAMLEQSKPMIQSNSSNNIHNGHSINHNNNNMSPRRIHDSGSSGAASAPNATISPLNISSPINSKKRDNIAELEQSLLDMDAELKSPRGLWGTQSETGTASALTSSSPSRKMSAGSNSSGSSSTKSGKRKLGGKSLSNDGNSQHQTITISASDTNQAASSASPTPSRQKGPPTRVSSAPESANHNVITRSAPPTTSSSYGAPSHTTSSPPSSTNAATAASSQKTSKSDQHSPAHQPVVSPAASDAIRPSSKSNSGGLSSTMVQSKNAEDREEQRLAKYVQGRRSAFGNSKTNIYGSSGHKTASTSFNHPIGLSDQEKAAFSNIFKKYDLNSDGVIDRSELELAFDSMVNNDLLKDLHGTVIQIYTHTNWEANGFTRSASVTLPNAVAYMTECRLGNQVPPSPFK